MNNAVNRGLRVHLSIKLDPLRVATAERNEVRQVSGKKESWKRRSKVVGVGRHGPSL